MVFTTFQCVKGLPVDEISYDIKCGEVDPSYHVNFAVRVEPDLFIKLGDKEITPALDKTFLFSNGTIWETVSDKPSVSNVIIVIGSC